MDHVGHDIVDRWTQESVDNGGECKIRFRKGSAMDLKQKILKIIFDAIDDLNSTFPTEKKLEKSVDLHLFGAQGRLDSLGFVNLIIAIEQRIEEEFRVSVSLADSKALSQQNSPFRTVGLLAEYICLLLEKKQ